MTQYSQTFDIKFTFGHTDRFGYCASVFQRFLWIYLIFGLIVSSSTVSNVILIEGQCDLYFMVQFYCLIFWINFILGLMVWPDKWVISYLLNLRFS